jgi:putative ABC transport system ATP-binding protein
VIALEDITKTYYTGGRETPVLQSISFKVDKGEYLAIMGPSGSGKTTLLNVLGCLDLPTAGSYRLDGLNPLEMDDRELSKVRNQKIGFVFQLFHLLPRATALKNVMLPLIYADSFPPDAEQRARRVLEEVGLSGRADYQPANMSGGEQQRVAVARALINDPSLVLADEPTGNLDSESSREVLRLFRRLNERGRTVIMVTHDRSVAEQAGRVLLLDDGLIIGEQRPSNKIGGEP